MKTIVIKKVATLILAFMFGIVGKAQTFIYKGDVNLDNAVDVADISSIVEIMAMDIKDSIFIDSNKDTIVVRDTIVVKDIPDADKTPEGVEPVDLGLPSRTKWANMNIGATTPGDYGKYFAWGTTEGYSMDDAYSFEWGSYEWMNSDGPELSWRKISKYRIYDDKKEGEWYDKDGKFVGDTIAAILLEDDAARQIWGSYWRMPSKEDFEELMDYCKFEWAQYGGVFGYKFTSKINNDKHIFLPAAGYRKEKSKVDDNKGCYWTTAVSPTNTARAKTFYFSSEKANISDNFRYCGLSIRPVRKD